MLAVENRKNFREKVKFRKFSTESENLSKIGGSLKHHGLRGDGCPWIDRALMKQSMTKKRSSEMLADENRKNFWEKVKFRKFSTESENLSKIGGSLKHHGLRGDGCPWIDRALMTIH